MSVIEARAIISATDKTGGVFDKIAGKFKDISKSAKALGAVKPIGFSGDFGAELAKLKLTGKEIDAVRHAWQNFDKSMKSGGPVRASAYFRMVGEWKTKTINDLRAVREAMEETRRAQDKLGQPRDAHGRFTGAPGGRLAAGARFAAGALGIGSGAYLAQGGLRGTVKAGATMVREGARDYLAGMPADESDRIKRESMVLSSRYNSVDASTLHERLRDTSMSMRSTDKAIALGDTMARGQVVMQSQVGKDQASEQNRKFFKGLDTLGKNQDPAQVRTLYDGYVKAQAVEGADMNLGELFTVAKMAKSAGATLDDKFLMTVAPGLMQDMGSARLGTALGSSMSQVIGGRATKASKSVQQEYGLRDKKGEFLNSREIMANPFDYAMNRLIPAMQKKGVDVNDNIAVTKATSQMFSNQMVADLFTKIITQREQYKAKGDQYDKSPGLSAAPELAKRDPFVAAEGFAAQLRNLAATLSEPVFPLATRAMGAMSSAISQFAKSFSEDDTAGKVGKGLGVGILGAGAVAGGIKGASALYQMFTGTAALNASALALNGSASALTAAAVRLGASGVASTAANAAAPAAAAASSGGASIWSKIATGAAAVAGVPYLAPAAIAMAAGAIVGAVKEAAGTTNMTGTEAATKASGGSRLDHIRKSFDEDRARFGLPPTQAGKPEPVKAEVEGNATLTGVITVAPSAYFMTTIDQKIDNKINAFKSTNITGRGTAGDTGRSSPDASASP